MAWSSITNKQRFHSHTAYFPLCLPSLSALKKQIMTLVFSMFSELEKIRAKHLVHWLNDHYSVSF